MDEEEEKVLVNFISEHWSAFEAVCEEHGLDADAIYLKLGGELE